MRKVVQVGVRLLEIEGEDDHGPYMLRNNGLTGTWMALDYEAKAECTIAGGEKNSCTFADGSFALMSRWEMKLLPTLDLRKAVSTSTCSLISLGFFREYSDIRLGFIKKWHVFPLCFIKKLYLCSTSLECGVWPFARPIQARRSPAHLMRSCLLLLTRPHVP